MPKKKADLISMYGLTDEMGQWIAQSCGGSSSPLNTLLDDDDWTFVIKMHGFVEAGLNQLLLTSLSNPDLRDIIAKLNTHGETGKIAFVKAFRLLPDPLCLFVRVLSKLRNDAVHDVKNFDLKLTEHVRSLKETQLRDWRTAMTSWLLGTASEHARNMSVKYPRPAIFSCCMSIMARAILFERYPKDKDMFEKAVRKFGDVWTYQGSDTLRVVSASPPPKIHQ